FLEKLRQRRDVQRLAASHLFDAAYYLKTYPDVAASGMDPIRHYVVHGAEEGRNPHPMFDTGYYREQNLDALSRGMNPLLHFAVTGLRDGRGPSPAYSPEAFAAATLRRDPLPASSSPSPSPVEARPQHPTPPSRPARFTVRRVGARSPEPA